MKTRVSTMYHIYDMNNYPGYKISHKPLTLDQIKALCGGDLYKLKHSGFRLVPTILKQVEHIGKE